MGRQPWAIICLAYLGGLLSTGGLVRRWVYSPFHPNIGSWLGILAFWLGLSLLMAWLIPRYWLGSPKPRFWLGMGCVALLAVVYCQWRMPVPQSQDISRLLSDEFPSIRVIVRGNISSEPRLIGGQNQRSFTLVAQKVEYLRSGRERKVTGNLYVTLPLEESANLTPSQSVTLQGRLYSARSPQNPGAFDFKTYLARQGVFASFKATKLLFQSAPPRWGWWKLRRRIVAAQGRWLKPETGKLLTSIALGQSAVDLPKDLRDRFTAVGMAHILAASGFQVALLLGVVLRLTQGRSIRLQLALGMGSLFLLIGLTGLQPSIFRAGVMGAGLLLGKALERQVRPLGALLLAATILLLWNPLWIWDLGFQLSFLATFGLVVSVEPIAERLDWLPPAIANAFAIPLAATLWVFPLLIRVFSVIPTYSVAINVLATPLVMILSLGGMISAAVALIFPLLGSAIAYLLGLPLYLLIGLVDWVYALPASSYAVGEISLMAMIAMYLLLIWGWLGRRRKRSLLITGLIALLVLVPVTYHRMTFTQVIVLATPSQPVVLIQSRGQTLLIDTHNPQITQYTLLPYLARQGVNDLQCWLQLSPQPRQSPSCNDPRQTVSVSQLRDRNFEPKPSQANPTPSSFPASKIVFKEFSLQWLSLAPAVLEVQYQQDPPWWIIQANSDSNEINKLDLTSNPAMIIGNPQSLQHLPLRQLEPQNVIAIANQLPSTLQNGLGSPFTHWWLTGQNGAIQWQPQQGWQKLRMNESDALLANI